MAESLVINAERSEEGGIRAKALATLCDACPYLAAPVRAKAASASRLPALVIDLTLSHHEDDLVTLSGFLLLKISFTYYNNDLSLCFSGFIYVWSPTRN